MDWAMAHPWMTFFLLALSILALDNIICSIARAFIYRRSEKQYPTDEKHDDILNNDAMKS